RTDPAHVPVPEYIADRLTSRRDIARYYDALHLQDREMRKILDALEQSGQAENTVVIYIGDHGRGLPREKRWCYDAGCHVPLIVRWPGRTEPGAREENVVSGVDIAPPILSIAGIEVPEHYQGQAFLGPYAADERRLYCLSARDRMGEAYDRVRTLRDKRFLYIRNYYPDLPYCQRIEYMERHNTVTLMRELYAHGQLNDAQSLWFAERKPSEELYDCQADPDNVRNLVDSPEHRETLERMRGALEATLAETPDLGELSERELIDRGIVCDDHLKKFLKMSASLPPYQRIGPELTVVEQPKS
ncbi:MAG: sulfatase/phosphatase domain-containing protein, partial [Candidatus Sumerlaeota bacterium]